MKLRKLGLSVAAVLTTLGMVGCGGNGTVAHCLKTYTDVDAFYTEAQADVSITTHSTSYPYVHKMNGATIQYLGFTAFDFELTLKSDKTYEYRYEEHTSLQPTDNYYRTLKVIFYGDWTATSTANTYDLAKATTWDIHRELNEVVASYTGEKAGDFDETTEPTFGDQFAAATVTINSETDMTFVVKA